MAGMLTGAIWVAPRDTEGGAVRLSIELVPGTMFKLATAAAMLAIWLRSLVKWDCKACDTIMSELAPSVMWHKVVRDATIWADGVCRDLTTAGAGVIIGVTTWLTVTIGGPVVITGHGVYFVWLVWGILFQRTSFVAAKCDTCFISSSTFWFSMKFSSRSL